MRRLQVEECETNKNKKTMKTILTMFAAVLFNALTGVVFGAAVGVSPVAGAVGANAIAALVGVAFPQGVLRAGVLKEIWTGEMVKALRAGLESTWLDGIPDQSSIVNNDVIHLVEVGIDPDVLVNNTTYPIPLQALDDKDIAISLDKFQTQVTPITDDELYAISYDKMSRVKESHANALNDSKFQKAAHALAPQKNTAKTPVIATTGEDDGTGRKRLTREDIIALKAKFDKLRIPTQGRRLVLCSDHVNDLLMIDQKFADQYYNYTTGKIANLYGFAVYEFANNPYYSTAGVKCALKSTTGYQASFAFYTPRVFKATGSTKMYWSAAETDPEYQRNKVNFRHYFICMPKLADAIGAIYSASTTIGGMISADPATVTIPAEGGSQEVAVTASGDYTVGEAPAGFEVEKTATGVKITAGENATGSPKTGTLTLTLDGESSKTAQITINQPKKGA